tara:strand:- start:93 stop:599 length:507 start_codon:yes stop_codon:yes gene_type:complete
MFNVGREFNKIASTQGAGFFGALPQANRKNETRFAGDALRNIGRYKAAETGLQAQAAEQAANRRNSLTNTLIGVGGNLLGTGLSAGITNMQASKVPDYSATSTPVTMGQITAPESWAQNNQAIQGLMNDGFSWQGQNPYSVNLPGGGFSSGGYGGMGQNPYSINTPGW